MLDGKREQDGYQPTLKIRGGAIVPLEDVVQNTGDSNASPLTLVVCLGADGQAEGSRYEDAGEGFGYRDGAYVLTHYTAALKDGAVVVKQDRREGGMTLPAREVTVELVTPKGVVKARGDVVGGIRVAP